MEKIKNHEKKLIKKLIFYSKLLWCAPEDVESRQRARPPEMMVATRIPKK